MYYPEYAEAPEYWESDEEDEEEQHEPSCRHGRKHKFRPYGKASDGTQFYRCWYCGYQPEE